ncbi:trace amine-associated receptor 13c-like [Antennarius striatus]|uniref:trace amine-associated receptor 13c-like n=1 Tax=Antennarius striatus TaxID=241820 RepID=UPI0035B3961F
MCYIEEAEAEVSEVDSSITQAGVTGVVAKLLGGKAPGVDEIHPDYLKSLDGNRKVYSIYKGSHSSASWGKSIPGFWRGGLDRESKRRFRRNKAVIVLVAEHGTSSTLSIECSRVHGSLPKQSTCVLWIWRRHSIVSLGYLVGRGLGVWGSGPFAEGCPVPVRLIPELGLRCWQISRRSQVLEGVRFADLDLQRALGRFANECDASGMRISTSKSEAMVLDRKRVVCPLHVVIEEFELCFPQLLNTSCRKPVQNHLEIIFLYSLLPCISVLTIILNLLVIISISHFKQLHTPTNLLLLSLAVSDFLVGLLLMPIQILQTGGCWFFGTVMCVMLYYSSFILTSASVGNMVLISVDRYVAICDPLCYSRKVTVKRVQLCVGLCWACSVFYSGVILIDFLKHPDRYNTCYGECVVIISVINGSVDILVTFIAPVTVIIILYMRVFVVAVSQARAMRSHVTSVTQQRSVCVTKKSEIKAARTLGIVVLVFLICFCPYYYPSFAGEDNSSSDEFSVFFLWLLYCNSCLNPMVYALFYPWFRRSMKLIVTLQILQPNSCHINIL